MTKDKNIITFPNKNAPDNDCVYTAPDGSKWYKFFIEYQFKCDAGGGLPEEMLESLSAAGAKFKRYSWQVDIWAQSKEEAEERLQAIKESGIVAGQIYSEKPE